MRDEEGKSLRQDPVDKTLRPSATDLCYLEKKYCQESRIKMSGKGIVILILSLLLVLFILQNTGMVSIKFLFWSLLMSRSILVFWFFFMGFILGYILFAARKKKGE